ncbi:radical SAM family heme chaperone HemW [Halodesulfovibrio sp.]|jgi:oxygen-independent coproporphyrinogen-3 oxidase|uniref:radical SAM family heme chaperone HemW n=1 Tax=Halodesulfovibrio sp. TaxID=1912772 RepID=UPI0025CC28AE|nr:radical SAM family heme chaperone HemW [Halodesulfovibrio sp.]MCT4626128.1 radical SAM family heme chaperone HemW [Halodesulfovibrio sp.]
MLLYLHVPFCRSKCGYCAFHSQVLSDDALQVYLDALMREIALWGDRLGTVSVETIFLGGGTPSMLPAKAIDTILNRVAKTFSVSNGAEISMEANPESALRDTFLHDVRSSGINRLSLGIQSLNRDLLHTLGRPHSAKQAIMAVERARQSGFGNINVDFIWGLPGQRLSHWLKELKAIVELAPDHLSCYSLTIEENTPFEKAYDDGELELPSDDDQSKMFLYGSDFLELQGFTHYEISNFARMGYQCRHNIGYWEGADYLGLGPSAVSTINGQRWMNTKDLSQYAEQTTSGEIGEHAETLTPYERMEELVMLRLRTARGLRLAAYKELTGRSFMEDFRPMITALHQHGLVKIRHGYLNLTKRGMLVSNTIIENLFEAMGRLQQMKC